MSPDPQKKRDWDMRQIAGLTTVPFLLMGGVAVGFLIGWWLDGVFDTDPYLKAVGVFMGVAAAALEIYQVLKKTSSEERDKDNERHPGS